MTTTPADLPIVLLDREDPVQVEAWVRCVSQVFLQGTPNDADVAQRLRRTEGHRIALVQDGAQVVATFRSFDGTVSLPGGAALPVHAVSGVTVLPTHRRRGLLTRMMTADLARAREDGLAASVLVASEGGIYGRFGFGTATLATTWTLHADRARFTTPRTGTTRVVLPAEWADVAARVYADARPRTPGAVDRTTDRWRSTAQVDPTEPGYDRHRTLVVRRDPDGHPDGVMAYTVKDSYDERVAAATLTVDDLVTSSDAAYADLWRYAAEVDLVTTVVAADRSPDEPLPLLLADARAARCGPVSDFLWIRLHDVPAALTARRYPVAGSLVLQVSDPLDEVAGSYRLEATADGDAVCTPTTDAPDVVLDVGALGSLLLGGAPGTTSVQSLRRSGRLVAGDGATARAAALFSWSDSAWCGTWF